MTSEDPAPSEINGISPLAQHTCPFMHYIFLPVLIQSESRNRHSHNSDMQTQTD